MAEYWRVSPMIWAHARRERWTEDERTMALYLLTCDHRTTEGFFWLPKAYIGADLGWDAERLGKAFASLLHQDFIAYDDEAEVLLIVKAMQYQRPDNANQQKAAIKSLKMLPRNRLWPRFRECAEAFAEAFAEALSQALPEGFGLPEAKPSPSPAPSPAPGSSSIPASPGAAEQPFGSDGAEDEGLPVMVDQADTQTHVVPLDPQIIATRAYDLLKGAGRRPSNGGWVGKAIGKVKALTPDARGQVLHSLECALGPSEPDFVQTWITDCRFDKIIDRYRGGMGPPGRASPSDDSAAIDRFLAIGGDE